MKIIITNQEAIQAWKDINSDLRLASDTIIEIERDNIAIVGTTSFTPHGAGIAVRGGANTLKADYTDIR